MAVTIDIRDKATPTLAAIKSGLLTRINPAIGEAVTKLFQNHLRANPANKQGYPSTNFWQRAARATNWQLLSDGVVVSVNMQGIRQRVYGGDIKPVNGTYLTIPATAAAYGHRAGEFNLKFAIVTDGNGFQRPALVARRSVASQVAQTRSGKFKHTADELGEVVFYWLVRQVHQEPNPDAIPNDEAISATAVERIQSIVQRALNRGGAK